MENISDTSDEMFLFIPELWATNLTFSIILAVFTFYLIIALFYHYIRVHCRKKEAFFRLSLEKKFSVISRSICILIAVISAIRNVNSIALLAIEKAAIQNETMLQTNAVKTACDVLPRIGISAVTLGTGFVYLFLWLRQRVFYIHPSMTNLNNKFVSAISLGIILLWFLYYVPATFSYFFLVQYQFHEEGGCLVDGRTSQAYLYIIISWLIVSVTMQIALLGLFVFPIIKRSFLGAQGMNRHSALHRQMRKAIIITIVCLLSDILSAGITWVFQIPNVTSFFALYSLNLSVNHLATVACFDQWKLMLWPWNFNSNIRPSKSDAKTSGLEDNKTKLTNT